MKRLPALLGLLTLVTGFVDAVTYLKFGHVFVANMTGNIVFLGFAFAGAKDISIAGSLVALFAFLVGAFVGGVLSRQGMHESRFLASSSLLKVVLLAVATLTSALGASPFGIIAALGITMGLQNAVARRLAIADVTTTVLTMTLTGIAADSSLGGGDDVRLGRRLLAVAIMFIGAFAGAALVLNYGIPLTLATAAAIVTVVSAGAYLSGEM